MEKNYIHCPVRAEVINPASGECKLTNVFQFTFRVDDAPADVPPLIFNTYRGKDKHELTPSKGFL